MISVISIGTDRKVFEEGSAVRERLLRQRTEFTELHVIVFAKRSLGLRVEQLGNLWLYPTNSLSKWLYVRDAAVLARALITQRGLTARTAVVTVQDPSECGLAGFFATRKSGLPLHIQIHTDVLDPEFAKLSRLNRIRVRIARFILPRARGIRVVSERIKRSLLISGANGTVAVSVLPVFSAQAAEWGLKPLRRFKKGEHPNKLVFMVSRLEPEKDFSTALEATARARRSGAPIRLVIIGEGSERQRILEERRALNIETSVDIELWQSDVAAFYRVADVILVTSRFEGYGLVLLEAAAHGQPVITTNVGIARELVTTPYERFVCPVGDAECIAKRLVELSQDAELRRKSGTALRANAKKLLFSEEEYIKRYRANIEQCIAKPVQ